MRKRSQCSGRFASDLAAIMLHVGVAFCLLLLLGEPQWGKRLVTACFGTSYPGYIVANSAGYYCFVTFLISIIIMNDEEHFLINYLNLI